MKKTFIYVLITNLIYILSTDICTDNDIGKLISQCQNKKNRTVHFFWNKECHNTDQIEIPQPTTLNQCKLKCKNNEYIDYDFNNMKLSCSQCPFGTYSSVNTTSIIWNEDILKQFTNKCQINKNDKIISNKCEGFKLMTSENYTSVIAGGDLEFPDAIYSYQFVYNIELKQDGKIIFTYKKNTLADNNGQFNFYVDYDLKLHDDEVNNDVKTFSQELEKGYHSLYWQYDIWNPVDNSRLYAEIISITIEGGEDEIFSCKPCIGINPLCNECPENSYKNDQGICEKCQDDEYSLLMKGKESCTKQPKCSEDFLIDYKSNKCVNGTTEHKFNFDKFYKCDNSTPFNEQVQQIPCNRCPKGNYLNDDQVCLPCKYELENTACMSCGKSGIAFKQVDINPLYVNAKIFNDNYCLDTISGKKNPYCPAWVFRPDGIYNSFIQTEANSKKVIEMDFETIIPEAFITFNITILTLSKEENLTIAINKQIDRFSDIKDIEYVKTFYLGVGLNDLEIIYSNLNKTVGPSVRINSILINGTKIGTLSGCTSCPHNTIKVKEGEDFICKLCPHGTKADIDSGICIKCDPNDASQECSSCPPFTYQQGDRCILNDIIHNKDLLIKHSVTNLKSTISTHCKNDNELCEGNFFGPLKDYKTDNIFFISYSENAKIVIDDFSYTNDDTFENLGHVFVLLNQRNKNNVKLLKNVGKEIEYVKIIPYVSERSSFYRPGILIKYGSGEMCNNGEEYKSILLIYCSKDSSNDRPRFVSQNGCTFIFEWESYHACPFCTKKDTSCRANKRYEIYTEEPFCKIVAENTTNPILHGYDEEYNEKDIILNATQVLRDSVLRDIFRLNDIVHDDSAYIHLFENKNHIRINLNENIYLDRGCKIQSECSVFDNLDSMYVYLAVLAPFVYFITSVILIVIYCKYKQTRDSYEKLRNELDNPENETEVHNEHHDKDITIEVASELKEEQPDVDISDKDEVPVALEVDTSNKFS